MKRKTSRVLIVFFLLFTIFISAYLYRSSFTSYFFQDDWFSFKISNAKSIGDFFTFFIPRTDVIYYRPLGMQAPFFLIKTIFGINPFPFHLLTFITHAINIVLVFFLVRLLVKSESVGLVSSFLYATSAVHYLLFFWSAIYAFVLGPTAFFLSFILFLLFLEKRRKSYLIFSWLIFFLGLLVNEIVVTLPVVIFLYLFIFNPPSQNSPIVRSRDAELISASADFRSDEAQLKIPRLLGRGSFKKIKFSSYLLSFFFISLLIFLPRFIFFPPPSKGIYQLGIGKHILTNIKTYFFWSFNWSEILTEQMSKPFIFNKVIVDEYSSYINVTLVTFFVLSFIFYLLSLILLKFRRDKKLLRIVAFGIAWFVIGLSPIVLFPYHKYPYYLPISLVGFLIISALFIHKMFAVFYKLNRGIVLIFLFIILSTWILSTKTTIDLNLKIHWAPRRAKIAKRLTEKAKKHYKYPFEDYCIYVSETSENKLALNDQDAFRLIYGDDRIKTIYTDEAGENVL